jgi:hypothetical protein
MFLPDCCGVIDLHPYSVGPNPVAMPIELPEGNQQLCPEGPHRLSTDND